MLKTRVIGDYTVSEAGPLEAARSVNFGAAYKKMIDDAQAKGDAANEDDLERLQALGAWSTHGPLISPRISPDEWLQMPLELVAELRLAAIELNPQWFAEPVTEKKKRVETAQIYARMSAVIQASQPELPPVVTLYNPEAFDVWVTYRAFDRRFLPSQIMAESNAWLTDMLTLDSLFEAMRPQDGNNG